MVHQGALWSEIWTGLAAPVEVMWGAWEAALDLKKSGGWRRIMLSGGCGGATGAVPGYGVGMLVVVGIRPSGGVVVG